MKLDKFIFIMNKVEKKIFYNDRIRQIHISQDEIEKKYFIEMKLRKINIIEIKMSVFSNFENFLIDLDVTI